MNTATIINECLDSFKEIKSVEKHLYIKIDHDWKMVEGRIERDYLPIIRFKKILNLD